MTKLHSVCDMSIFTPHSLPILFVITLAFGSAVLYGNIAFSITVRSTKKRYSSHLKKGFRFPENLFQW